MRDCTLSRQSEDMEDSSAEETAQYSIHAVGLLFKHHTRTVVICDPNGALLPGGSMEFLSVPVRGRAGPPTTSVSQHGREQLPP